MRQHLAILAFAAMAVAGAAYAAEGDDEVISTAQAKPTAQALAAAPATPTAPAADATTAPAKPMTTQEQIAAFIAANPNPGPVSEAPRGLVPAGSPSDSLASNGDDKRQIHGSMGVSVGTGGYRSAYATAIMPVGENTLVGVAVSQTNYGKHGRGLGYVDGPYGYGGYGSPWARGGENQSVALSVMTGVGGRRGSDTPEGCAPGFRDGSRYVEPLWVQDMRDGQSCSAAAPAR